MRFGSSSAGKRVGAGPASSAPLGPVPTLLQGKALGGFTNTNTVSSAANQLVDFRPGKTLWVVFQSLGVGTIGTENILGCLTGNLTKGWILTRQATTGTFYILAAGGGYYPLATPSVGVNVFCLVWAAADSTLHWSLNGGPWSPASAVPLTAYADVTSASYIGSPAAGFSGITLASGRVLAFATWASEATQAQAQANTFTTGNRFQLPAAVRSAAVVDFQANRDWNGSASSITTLGSSPLTYAVAGTPTLFATDEVRYAANKFWFDGKIAVPQVDGNGNAYTIRDSYSRLKCTTDSLVIAVEAYTSDTVQGGSADGIGVYTNGSWVSETTDLTIGIPEVLNLAPGAGTGKTVEVWNTAETMAGSSFPYTREGCFIGALRLPKYLLDGVTSSNSSMILPARPQHRLVLLGDSIFTGFFVTTFSSQSITALLRADYPTSGTGGVTAHTAGSDSIGNVASTTAILNATVAQIVAELDGTVSNTLWIQLGTNDYGASPITVANFQSYYGQLLDAIHALAPSASIYCQSPIQRISPSTEATEGNGTLGAYRTAISTVVSTRTAFCTYIEGAAGAIVSNANMYSDGIHLTTAGDAQYKAFIKTTLGY